MCPQLAILLKAKFNILSVGTCRANRKGWPKPQLSMTKSGPRGQYKIVYDNINQVCCMQWRDTKVVNLVSTLNDACENTCERREGANRIRLPVPNDYNEYSKKCSVWIKATNLEHISVVSLIVPTLRSGMSKCT